MISILNVTLPENPTPFTSPISFEITFQSDVNLDEDVEFKIIYVGAAENTEHDQLLEEISLGPIQEGVSKFLFRAPPPDIEKIPKSDVLGVTVILLMAAYKGKDFYRVGYYVNNDYTDEELKENPPATPIIDKITRNILLDKPRVTRWQIEWDN
mmetsp:Transcript_24273/g.30883  ORF Transcript_24273/g.30883 Transcript_24273/m.30883 type:complete len:154 (-) Transcript_24273:114-575(-)|eukprot:CAMPEP_0206195062 /NCGR_PEP_ID=MMETSP0166-20121206/7593_1 /ASSEMBLY_ACC=CAM_ASM_000260 /TAXON_ID=95228 /ORGANISM="Vannella robusta, Strain DIVA3 518/3/11/1/6" /LENGTH=153 /DNA_ID=CAMNT_0053612203 /DNA_START=90 /DNA_END=551 /DNA_ORIENTATION=-